MRWITRINDDMASNCFMKEVYFHIVVKRHRPITHFIAVQICRLVIFLQREFKQFHLCTQYGLCTLKFCFVH